MSYPSSLISMHSKKTLACSVLFSLLLTQNCLGKEKEDPNVIGSVRRTKGESFILRADKSLEAKGGLNIEKGDLLETHKNGMLEVQFLDNSSLVVGKDSKFIIQQMDIDGTYGRTGRFSYQKGVFNLKISQMPKADDDVMVQIPNGGTIKLIAADLFGGYLEKEYFDVGLLGTGQIIIERGDLRSVIKIPGFGAKFDNEGNDAVKPKRLTPEKIERMQDSIKFE